MRYLILIFFFTILTFSGKAQNIDSSNLIVPALLKLIEFDNRTWTKEEVLILLDAKNISLHFIKSEGFRDMKFFSLQYPKGGIPVGKINERRILLFDPELIQEKIIFAYDIPTNKLFALSKVSYNDLLSFYYIAQHRTTFYSYKKFHKKKAWKRDLKIEGISMVDIFEICQSLRRISN